MPKNSIHVAQAPKAIGPYSVAVRAGNTVYLSGQIGLDPETMQLADGIEQQMHQAFKNMQAVLAAIGISFKDVVKVTIFITDMKTFPMVNQIMSEYFSEPYPARSTVGVKELPKGAVVEIEGDCAGVVLYPFQATDRKIVDGR